MAWADTGADVFQVSGRRKWTTARPQQQQIEGLKTNFKGGLCIEGLFPVAFVFSWGGGTAGEPPAEV